MPAETLRFSDLAAHGQAFHFARAVLSRQKPKLVHDHDFFEVFWIQHGRAKHRINGEKHDLKEGDLVFVRPQDRHSLQGKAEETHLVNVAFPAGLIGETGSRLNIVDQFFWQADAQPHTEFRNTRQLVDLSKRALALESGPRTRMAAEAFLIPLLSEITQDELDTAHPMPKWLRRACTAAKKPEVFQDGAAGLVRVSGRGHAHVSRMMRQYVGETPSEYVNRIRMDHAGRLLLGSSEPLEDIALQCGIRNLSHFHKLFRQHFLMPPNQYRRSLQKQVVQPL